MEKSWPHPNFHVPPHWAEQCPPRAPRIQVHPEPQNVTLFGNRVFAAEIKFRQVKKKKKKKAWALHAPTGALIRGWGGDIGHRGKAGEDTGNREEVCMRTKTKMGLYSHRPRNIQSHQNL